ncbi:MAG: hypothetical protein ACXWZU_07735 [Actinomycetota bacterium]
MTAHDTPKAKGLRRLERWMIGVLFAVIAFVLEKAVMRSVRKGGGEPSPAEPEQVTTQLTGSGAEVDLE